MIAFFLLAIAGKPLEYVAQLRSLALRLALWLKLILTMTTGLTLMLR